MKSSDRSFEQRLARALHDVQTPEGLRDRLLSALRSAPSADALTNAALTNAAPTNAAPSNAAAPTCIALSDVSRPPRALGGARFLRAAGARLAPRMSRRSVLAAGVLAASVALGGFAWWNSQTAVDPRDDLATLAVNWVPHLSNAWKPMSGAPTGFPAWKALTGRPHGWQSATNVVGTAAVAYDISRPGLRAVLFAVRMVAPQIPLGPPPTPFSTGGQAIATWRSGGMVYVLVVQGDEQSYRSLIRGAASPLA